jgi:sulfatase maturation enzyme AslB (radical SAM superfamily)
MTQQLTQEITESKLSSSSSDTSHANLAEISSKSQLENQVNAETEFFSIVAPDILLTEKCNFNCKYCFEKDKQLHDIDKNALVEYISSQSNTSFFMFGGEPLIAIDQLIAGIQAVEALPVADKIKSKLRDRVRKVITNGSLIKKNLQKLKKWQIRVQISIDGPAHVHDMNRVDKQGRGTFDRVIHAIELCQKHEIEWSMHGVINRQTLPYLAETTLWFFDTYIKYKGFDEAAAALGRNYAQIVFEEDYTDADIDILITQIQNVADRILQDPRFSRKQKLTVLQNFFTRKGGVCGAGNGLWAFSTDFNIYPCHRMASIPNNEQYRLGNAKDIHHFNHFPLMNTYVRQKWKNQVIYSASRDNYGYRRPQYWFNWCPSTNLQTSGSVYYQNPKYNVMHTELLRFIEFYTAKHRIPLKSQKQLTNCH